MSSVEANLAAMDRRMDRFVPASNASSAASSWRTRPLRRAGSLRPGGTAPSTRRKGFYRIVLPLSGPGLATTAILCFLYSWNDFFFALILTRTEAMMAPVAVVNFMNDEGWEWGKFAAGGTMVMLPVLFFSILVRRFLVHGLTAGALKGLILTANNEALDDPHPPRLSASWCACSHQQTFKPAVPCDYFALDSSDALS